MWYSIPHSMAIFLTWKKKKFVSWVPPAKSSLFKNYTPWQTSNSYCKDRVDPDAPSEMKIRETKKKNNFVRERFGIV